jgi:hypothetical protein
MSFTPPTDLTPYEPASNQATVKKLTTTPVLDVYAVDQTGHLFGVPKNTPMKTVLIKAGLDWAWQKLTKYAPAILTDLPTAQAANTWFAANVAPLYV